MCVCVCGGEGGGARLCRSNWASLGPLIPPLFMRCVVQRREGTEASLHPVTMEMNVKCLMTSRAHTHASSRPTHTQNTAVAHASVARVSQPDAGQL